jgi:hypothetical protein
MKTLAKHYRVHLGIALAFILGFIAAGMVRPQPAQAGLELGDIFKDVVKIGAVALAVDEFGDDLNDLINNLLDNNDASTGAATKVVIIVSPIGNKHIGAAQVTGPEEAVNKVKAVVQLETSFMDKMFRVRAMVPIDGEDPSNFTRVKGVAVSAVIDIKI